ncbi:MAG TPA: NAD-dependent epimerase/dehydratase family protein [Verrucomicrobiae bacterium]|nr:NAD-dependent epimerase/dehydratase family protein [Verrucomicrobiae bacterium]
MNGTDITQHFRGQPVLVTGGLGFIGSNLARRLVDLGARVTVLDALVPRFGGNRFNLHGYEGLLRVHTGDLRDARVVGQILPQQAFLFNLAGQVSHLDSMEDPLTDLEINCSSQLRLLEACRRLNPDVRIVYASTRQVYGRPQSLPVSEDHPLAPVDVNGIHKLAAGCYHLLYHQVYGLRSTSLRLTNTYGPRMRVADSRQTFLGLWLRRVIEGEEFLIFGTGCQKRDFNYVDDVVEAMLRTAIAPATEGQVYNLGGQEIVSLLEVAKLLVELHGAGSYRVVPFPTDRERIDIGDYAGDFARFKTAVGWEPGVPLRSGLERTINYYEQNRKYYW